MFGNADRKTLNHAREVLHGARKWVRINQDRLSARQIPDIGNKIAALEQAGRSRNVKDAAARAEQLEQTLSAALPARKQPGLRENVEVFLVAAIVAMAVRTFFFQPFKIPTGSMQPTLYGIVPSADCENYTGLFGRLQAGAVRGLWPQQPNSSMAASMVDFITWAISGHSSRGGMCVFSGDHIFVDKLSYHFRKPQRGEVVVFETTGIPEMDPSAYGKFYIKRLIGLGDQNDVIRIVPPHVLVNDKVLDTRQAFERIYSMQNDYHGYVNQPPRASRPPYLSSPESTYAVPPKHFFVMGDNSVSSYDGRYWGSVPNENLVGRAVLVYWPFSGRFGRID